MKRTRKDKKPRLPPNLFLEEIIGLTTKNGNGLAASISSSKCAYIAGCVVVLYDVNSGTQSHLMAPNRMPKRLSCVALSRDGSIVAAGESGNQPAILVWDCTTLAFICELKGHQYGVRCMSLPSDGNHLLSVESPRDGCICIWDWRNKIFLTKVKATSLSSPIASSDFYSIHGNFFVTAGKNHFKFWKVRRSFGCRPSARSASVTMERTINLDPCKEWTWVAVASLSLTSVNATQASELTPFYAVTGSGTLCMISHGSSVIKSVVLEVEKCFALSTSNTLVACACSNGLVKLFGSSSLHYAGRLCYVEAERSRESNVMDCKTDCSQDDPQTCSRLPNAIACQFSTLEKLVVIYDDHSLYIWNIHDIHKATRCCKLVTHSGCIWDIRNVPCENMHDVSLSCVAEGCSGGLSFATCSADGTIRLWDFELQSTSSLATDKSYSETACVGDSVFQIFFVSAGIFERESVAVGTSFQEFRSMAVSSDGKYLASGDCQGNIHIFNLCTSEYTCIQDAHGAEILSLSFSFTDKNGISSTEVSESHLFLASGGRDGIIHLFDVDRNFNLVGSIGCHSSAVTAVKVSRSGHLILSCGDDRSLVLHSVDMKDTDCTMSCLYRIATTGTIYDMVVDDAMKIAVTVGQDKKIDVFDIQSGKLIKGFKHGGIGDPSKVTTDGSCSYIACSYSSKCILVYDYMTGEIVARATGHSDIITGIVFLPDCRHLISVGADGCIFVWKLPAPQSSRMLQKSKKVPCQFLSENVNQPITLKRFKSYEIVDHNHGGCSKEASENQTSNQPHEEMLFPKLSNAEPSEFRFSISRLPNWAQRKVENIYLPTDTNSSKDILEVSDQVSGNLFSDLSYSDSSDSSQSLRGTYSWKSNHRWLTIHTVCMDSLDSPETCHVKGLDKHESSIVGRSQSKVIETSCSRKRLKLSSLGPSIDCPTRPDFKQNEHVNLQDDPSREPDFKHNEHANLQDDPFEGYKDDNASSIKNLDNLSAQLKRDGDMSMTRSNSRFCVRRELLEGRKKSLGVHAHDSISTITRKPKQTNKPSTSSLEDAGYDSPLSLNKINSITLRDSVDLDSSPYAKIKSYMNTINIKNQEAFDVDKVKEVEIVRSCDEALSNLEAAAENAMHLFAKLATLKDTGDQKSRGSEVQLYDKAAEKLPSIEKQIHAMTKSLHSASISNDKKTQLSLSAS